MALTRDFKQTIVERVQRDPAFGKALLDEGATMFLNGEPDTARLILRGLGQCDGWFCGPRCGDRQTQQEPSSHVV